MWYRRFSAYYGEIFDLMNDSYYLDLTVYSRSAAHGWIGGLNRPLYANIHSDDVLYL